MKVADNLRLQIGVPTGGLPNLLPNPDARFLSAGWSTFAGDMILQPDRDAQRFTLMATAAMATSTLYGDGYPLGAGVYVAARYEVLALQGGAILSVEALDANGVVIGIRTSGVSTTLGAKWTTTPLLTPAGTVKVRVRVELYSDGLGFPPSSGDYVRFTKAMLAHSATAGPLASGFAYAPPHDWLDILGPTSSIDIGTGGLDVGTLTAEILDADLDPAYTATIRPGKPVRLQALVSGVWEDVYTGTTAEGTTAYAKAKSDPSKIRVTLTAANAITRLANQAEARGVEGISDLRHLLKGKGVGWLLNGESLQYGDPTIISRNDSATTLDQIAITRDSNLGYAWVDRHNLLNGIDGPAPATAGLALTDDFTGLSETLQYSYVDADVAYSTASCINEVAVKFLRWNAEEQTTEEIAYGPYRHEASIATYGPYRAEFTIQGVTEDEALIKAYAETILAANGIPEVTANAVTINAKDETGIQVAATTDLYDPIRVVYADRLDSVVRVSSIKHQIEATNDGGKWLTTYGFEPVDSVAAPTVTPSPPASPDAVGLMSSRYRSTTQALSNNVETTVAFDAARASDGIEYAAGVWTVPKRGRYAVNAAAHFVYAAGGARYVGVRVNGVARRLVYATPHPTSPNGASAVISMTLKLAAGDQVSIIASQNSGATLNLHGTSAGAHTAGDITYLGI